MLRHLALILIVCALIVPRVMWGAHEAGHDQPVVAGVEHVHHDGHVHFGPVHAHDDELSDGEDRDGKLAHDHRLADVLSAMAATDQHDFDDPPVTFGARHMLDRGRTGEPDAHPNAILRPPRVA